MVVNSALKDPTYTIRRYLVDEFFARHCGLLPSGSSLLDLGGNGIEKRGRFDIDHYGFSVTYLNCSGSKRPDVQADAAHLPFRATAFDVVICSELLEHIHNPDRVLSETYRVLKPGGVLLLTVPFLFPVHADPRDYLRYTDQYLSLLLKTSGFEDIEIEWQGKFWSVAAEMCRGLVCELQEYSDLRGRLSRSWLARLWVGWLKDKAVHWDASLGGGRTVFFRGVTTGFGIRCVKASTD